MNLKIIRNQVEYQNLCAGDCFYYGGNYYMKIRRNSDYPQAVRLLIGELETFSNNTLVIPVDAVVHLTEIPTPTKEEK